MKSPLTPAAALWNPTLVPIPLSVTSLLFSPKDFPSCLAIAEQSTSVLWGDLTGSWSYTIIFNGPVRNEIAVNSGGGVMEPYARANSVIGNFLTVLTKTCNNFHAANTSAGVQDPSVVATNFRSIGSYMGEDNLCVGENEENLPAGWNSLAVQKGFTADQSVVTLGMGFTKNDSVGEMNRVNPCADYIGDYTRAICGYGAITYYIDPWIAQILHDSNTFKEGQTFLQDGALNLMPTKEAFATYEAGYVQKTIGAYWSESIVATYVLPMARAGIEPYATYLSQLSTQPNAIIHPYLAENINTIVTGGLLNTIWDVTDFQLGAGVDIATWK